MACSKELDIIRANKRLLTTILILLLILCSYAFYLYKNNEWDIKKNQKLGVAYIYRIEFFGRYKYKYAYFFIENLNSRRLDSFYTSFNNLSKSEFLQVENKYFPVVYDSTNTKYHKLLLDPSDYIDYNIPYRDTAN